MLKVECLQAEDQEWQALKRGDYLAFESIYRTYIQVLHRYGMSITADEDIVADAIQDIFTDIWHKHQRLGVTNNVKFYLLKSLKNRLIRVYSAANRFEELNEYKSDFIESVLYQNIDNQEGSYAIEEKLVVCLSKLSPQQQEIVRLRFYENLSHQQIAELLKMAPQSAKNLLHRAIESLRKQLYFCLVGITFILFF